MQVVWKDKPKYCKTLVGVRKANRNCSDNRFVNVQNKHDIEKLKNIIKHKYHISAA
jgi:hypothetical protein